MKKKANPKTREGRIALAGMITRLFDLWKLDEQDRECLLGLPKNSKATLEKYRNGAPLDDNQELLQRVAYLLSIHKTLRLLFPENMDLTYKWPTIPNRALGGLSPLEFIRKNGFSGLLAVKRYLEREADR